MNDDGAFLANLEEYCGAFLERVRLLHATRTFLFPATEDVIEAIEQEIHASAVLLAEAAAAFGGRRLAK